MEKCDTIVDALSDLKERGYNADLEITPFCLYCGDLDIRLNPDAFNADGELAACALPPLNNGK